MFFIILGVLFLAVIPDFIKTNDFGSMCVALALGITFIVLGIKNKKNKKEKKDKEIINNNSNSNKEINLNNNQEPISINNEINQNRIKCPKCLSDNIHIQIISEIKLKNQHHGLLYWLIIGWWLELLLWFFLTIPRLLIAVFGHKKQKITQKNHKEAICQNCGHSWRLSNIK